MRRKHPFDKDQLEIVFYQLIEVLDRLMAMNEDDRNTPRYADALSEFVGYRDEFNRQLDAVEARLS